MVITTKQTESENPNPDGCSLRQLSQEGRNVRIERQTIYTGRLPVAPRTAFLKSLAGEQEICGIYRIRSSLRPSLHICPTVLAKM